MLWIVPSRSRPDNIAQLVTSWHATRSVADLLVVIDNDDPELDNYRNVLFGFNGYPWLNFVESDRLRLVGSLNKFAVTTSAMYRQIGFMGDDHRPRSPIWDGLMAAELRKMGTGIVYANDLYQGKNLPTSVAMTSDIIQALGYMVPPTIQHLYADNFWLTIGRKLGIIEYMDHVIIEHKHPHAGKAESDAQYVELNSNAQHDKDKHAFETYVRKGLDADLAKIRKVMC